MESDGWHSYGLFNGSWNQQEPDLLRDSGLYDEPTLDSALAQQFTNAPSVHNVLAPNGEHVQLPMDFAATDGMGHIPQNFLTPVEASYRHSGFPISQMSDVSASTEAAAMQQGLSQTMSMSTAYGMYPDNSGHLGPTWFGGNLFPITDQENLVYSPLPMQQPGLPSTTQHSPISPQENRRSQYSPITPTARRTTRFTTKQRNTLQTWYDHHKDDTYASEQDLVGLQASTGLDARQVRAWLSRARRKEPIVPRRQLSVSVPNKTPALTAISQVCAAGTIASVPNKVAGEGVSDDVVLCSLEVFPSSTRASSRDRDVEDNDGWITEDDTPNFSMETLGNSPDDVLHWWMGSLPNQTWEDPEPPGLQALTPPHILPHPTRQNTMGTEDRTTARKLAKLRTGCDDRLGPFETYDPSRLSPGNAFNCTDESRDNSASSEYGKSLLAGSTATRRSDHSGNTSHSAFSSMSHESRKGRRRMHRQYHKQRLSGSGKSDDSSTTGANDCSVCGKTFSCKSSCKRHIQSVHAPSVVWVCGPTTPVIDANGNELDQATSPCCFCSQQDCQHRLVECWTKPIQQRTFYRRDNFKQHLVGTHKVNPELVSGLKLDPWQRALPVSPHTEQS